MQVVALSAYCDWRMLAHLARANMASKVRLWVRAGSTDWELLMDTKTALDRQGSQMFVSSALYMARVSIFRELDR